MKCINHVDVEATATCAACNKNLCRLCVQPDGSSIFCSDECIKAFNEKESLRLEQQPSTRKIKIKLAIMLSLITAILYLAYTYASLGAN